LEYRASRRCREKRAELLTLRSGLIRILEDAANEAIRGACELLLSGLLGLSHFGPALPLRLSDALACFFAQDSFASPGTVRATKGS